MIVADEYEPYDQVEGHLPMLKAHNAALCVAVRAEESDSPALASLIQASAKAGVPLIAWMLLPEDEGYWFGEPNRDAARTQVEKFADWVEAGALPLEWIMLDMELMLQQTRLLETGDLFGTIIPMLNGNMDRAEYNRARDDYAALVSDMHGRGFKVSAAAYPFILDDLADGDPDIQDAFNTPIEGVGFDELYFMSYRSSFKSLLDVLPTPDVTYQYARAATEGFGPRALLGMGTIAGIGQVEDPGFTDPGEIAADVAAAKAAGHSRFFVYSLDGMVVTGEPDAWLGTVNAEAERPEPSSLTDQVRDAFRLLDDTLLVPK